MTGRTKGLVVAALHIGIVCTLGAKLLADRATLPRVWAEVAPYDPDLPIRGRYVSLQVKVEPRGFTERPGPAAPGYGYGHLSVEGDHLIATRADPDEGHPLQLRMENERLVATLSTPVAYFIPEHATDPSRRAGLMVEVTLPRKGPPRPIRLGVKEGETIRPLDL
ncbi:MAG: hypothetical protein DMF50_13115 [Acidobacteria bacterium]|nr:MAG: hypothetical protein DMF50_13115 [Acidobacteriota bacterium]